MEATRSIRNENFSNLVDGTHGLAINTNKWTFSGTSDATGIYTRTVDISTYNITTKLITVQVEWQNNLGMTKSISLNSYLADISRIILPPPAWSTPGIASSLDLSGNANTIDIDVQGNYAYLVRPATEDIVVVNISDPDNPFYVASYDVTGNAIAIDVEGNYAYVSSDSNSGEFAIVNISNPLAMSTVGTLNLAGNQDPQKLFYDSNKVYLTRTNNSSGEFYIIDTTTPASPTILGNYEISGGAVDVFYRANKAYVAASANSTEVLILDVTNPATIVQLSVIDLAGNDDGDSITGFINTIIVSRAGGLLYTINVSNALSPSVSGSYNTGADVHKISINNSNTYAYLATSNTTQEFQVIDITNLSAPALYGSFNLSQDATGIKYVDSFDRAFLSDFSNSEELIILEPQ